MYSCDSCSKSFSRRDNMLRHKKTMHEETGSETEDMESSDVESETASDSSDENDEELDPWQSIESFQVSTMRFKCIYCHEEFEVYRAIISHLIENHTSNEIVFQKSDGTNMKKVTYNITPDMCREQGRTITIDNEKAFLHISKRNVIPKESPLKKIFREDSSCGSTEGSTVFEQTMMNSSDYDKDVSEQIAILPDVVKMLKDCGKYDDYRAFNKLISDGRFPMDNIAFLLFLDVVRWYNLDQSATFMRYSEECKLFWKTGYKLFHGRFVRFMGGPKNKGHVSDSTAQKGYFAAEDSNINFAVPDIKILREESKMIPSDAGIITDMIDIVASNDTNQSKTYKICVDGKKINPTSTGTVNLWGNEDEPTYEQRKDRQNELSAFKSCTEDIEHLIDLGHSNMNDLSDTQKENLVHKCRNFITVITYRIKDLRQLKVKKETALNIIRQKVEGDWRSSNYALVISSLRTNIYQIDNCIEDMLNTNEKLCKIASRSNTTLKSQYSKCNEIYLENKGNYSCLGEGSDIGQTDTTLVKQRSDTWHNIRKSSIVTGSTINKAIGLAGLKEQKGYIDVKAGRKESESISSELQARFDYGTANELNAVATLVSTFLPAFVPDSILFEEGCYIIQEGERTVLVISPDGSIRRQSDMRVLAGLEIKCPTPGKVYTTQIQYTLPHYYVPQVLSEMRCLEVDILYFVSYCKDSTAVHRVDFDEDLWDMIWNESKGIDLTITPKRLSPNIESLKKHIKDFTTKSVTLVAEFKSRTAKVCKHLPIVSGRIFHDILRCSVIPNITLDEIQQALLRGTDCIQQSDRLSRPKANEVLVFMLADLDRINRPDLPNAFPIAYALKGYSMKATAMRNMIERVLHELFLRGIYTPVVSYDGQWASLAFRTQDDTPLTLLELQKQVFNEAKSKKKSEMIKVLFGMGNVTSDKALADQVNYEYNEDKKSVTVSRKSTDKIFRPSLHVCRMLSEHRHTKTKPQRTNAEDEKEGNDILSSISNDVLIRLSDKEIEEICNVDVNDTPQTVNLCETVFEETNDAQNDELHVIYKEMDKVNISDEYEEMDLNEDTSLANATEENSFPQHNVDSDMQGISDNELTHILLKLKDSDKRGLKWASTNVMALKNLLCDSEQLMSKMNKNELNVCLEAITDRLKKFKIRHSKYWNKIKLVSLLNAAATSTLKTNEGSGKRRRCTPAKLVSLCRREVNKIPKTILNALFAEHEMETRVHQWRDKSPFASITSVNNEHIAWFSVPEFNQRTLSYVFSYLDVHHLITNCRIKVCKDGIPEKYIDKQAWLYVAKSNKTNLKISHVEDLVDKQSDAIARETFSEKVENVMKEQFPKEAKFCRLIREFYDGEDEPGLNVEERTRRRIALRDWLLQGVNFCRFPPYGSHILGIPNIMFQGFLTNIERRLQLFPYVKAGAYNVRALRLKTCSGSFKIWIRKEQESSKPKKFQML